MNKQLRNDFLKAFYLKAKGSTVREVDPKIVGKLLGIPKITMSDIVNYLVEKKLIDDKQGFGDAIRLTSTGIDYVEALKEGKLYKIVKFLLARYLPHATRNAYGFIYYYQVINEDGSVLSNDIRVYASDVLSMIWSLQFDSPTKQAEKILLQFAKNTIIKKLREGTLNESEEVVLMTDTQEQECPYDPKNLIDTESAEYEVEVASKLLIEQINENKLAASLIEMRDYINAVFYNTHKQKLLFLDQERNLLDFFKSAKSEEELSHRVSSLGQCARSMNNSILRTLASVEDKGLQSVALLEKFLAYINKPNATIIETLKHIGRIRQGYPVHTDEASKLLPTYKYFGIKYPVESYETAWTTILSEYLKALTLLKEIIEEVYPI